jgi:hypothetical protein
VYVVVVVDLVTVLVVAYMGEGAAIGLAQCKVYGIMKTHAGRKLRFRCH